jgi:hypothetical protein
MAFSSDPFEKDKLQQEQQSAAQPQSTQLTSGGGAFIDQQIAPQGAQAPQTQQKQAGSGRFQNLQKYITANQAGAQQIGQKVQQNVAGQAQKVTQNIGEANKQLMSGAQQELGRLEQGKQAITQALETPSEYASDEEKFKQFQQYRKGESQAQDIQNLAQLQNQAANIGELSKATQSEQGRLGLLRSTFANKGYGQGASRLDQLLLQANPNNLRQLSQATKQAYSQQTGNIQSLQKQKEEYNKQIAEQATARQKEAVTGLETNIGSKESELTKKATEGQTQQELLEKYAKEAFGKGGEFSTTELSAEDKAKAGIEQLSAQDILRATGLQGGQTYFRLKPEDILRAQQVTQESVASEADVKRLDDLRKLQEMENTFIRNRDLIGKYKAGQLQGVEELQKGIESEKDIYQKAFDERLKNFESNAASRASLENKVINQMLGGIAGQFGAAGVVGEGGARFDQYGQDEANKKIAELQGIYNTYGPDADWLRYTSAGQGVTRDIDLAARARETQALQNLSNLQSELETKKFARIEGEPAQSDINFDPNRYQQQYLEARQGITEANKQNLITQEQLQNIINQAEADLQAKVSSGDIQKSSKIYDNQGLASQIRGMVATPGTTNYYPINSGEAASLSRQIAALSGSKYDVYKSKTGQQLNAQDLIKNALSQQLQGKLLSTENLATLGNLLGKYRTPQESLARNQAYSKLLNNPNYSRLFK